MLSPCHHQEKHSAINTVSKPVPPKTIKQVINCTPAVSLFEQAFELCVMFSPEQPYVDFLFAMDVLMSV